MAKFSEASQLRVMETATAFNKSVKCRKKRKCVVCRRGDGGGGGDDRSGLRDKCHQFLPQFVSRLVLQTKAIRRFVITVKAPTRAFSWLKAATTAFTFKTLC